MADAFTESTKDTGRMVVLGAVSTLVTYGLNRFVPNLPPEVLTAILALVMAGLTWLDSYLHNRKDIKANGLVPF